MRTYFRDTTLVLFTHSPFFGRRSEMRTILPVSALLCVMAAMVLIGYTPNSLAAQGASGARGKTAD